MVTTTTTLPASRPIDDASSEERVEPKAKEADMGSRNLLSAFPFVKRVSAHFARNFI